MKKYNERENEKERVGWRSDSLSRPLYLSLSLSLYIYIYIKNYIYIYIYMYVCM